LNIAVISLKEKFKSRKEFLYLPASMQFVRIYYHSKRMVKIK